ncbi:MaoC/PaaZ C-terminal domain-containing protein [Pseudomonas sp. GD03721]|nr:MULTISPECIES: MaoC/PaaZ C-terminal domain-containing protein [unclassified Pseudomonas]MDH1440504.1 MaoC/PaaZ C-terminal domain-containing protein [Pseudomonas sp. GD03722]WGG03410.1 MaoC/PaaZ C-terminal domain-containing protein [Pseudomonas sp. GD03721]WGG07578.1 MaoC/PaaZ C-terminal domain-containing protein [Pseudomonas sp. GD03919]
MTTSFAHAQPGERIAEFVSDPISAEMLHRYAEASGDSNPLHLDRAFAQKAGFDDVIVHGMLGMALLGRLLDSHFAAEDIRSFSARFLSIMPVGKRIRCQAEVAGREDGHLLLNLSARVDGAEQVAISGQAVIGKPQA